MGFYNNNYSLGIIHEYRKVKSNDYKELYNFLNFKQNNFSKLPIKIKFQKKQILNLTFQCINWCEYKYNDYLSFHILKARTIDNKTVYFQFKKYNYLLYKKTDILADKRLNQIYKLSKKKSNQYDIYNHEFLNYEETKVNHYTQYCNFQGFCFLDTSQIKNLNHVTKTDFILLKTNFRQNKSLSSCENNYKDCRWFYVLNNIEPAQCFQIIDFEVYQSEKQDNIYFVRDEDIQKFFQNIISINKDVDRKYLSFDIESEVTNRPIDSELNILTHCGVEFFNTLYDKDFLKHKELLSNKKKILEASFNICLINIDLYIRQELKNKNKLNLIAEYTDLDKIYNYIRLEEYKKKNNILNSEIEKIKKKILKKSIYNYVFPETDISIKSFLIEVLWNKKKFIFCKEHTIIDFIFELMPQSDCDTSLTFNGNSYDYPQLARKQSFLNQTTISTNIKIKSLYQYENVVKFESQNEKTNYNTVNLLFPTPYYTLDLFNYVKKFHPNLPSYSLKEVAKLKFNINAIFIKEEDTNSYCVRIPDQDKKQLFKFYKVLLSSNYCYISDTAYKITSKETIITDLEIYDIDINALINDIETINEIDVLVSYFTITPIKDDNLHYLINTDSFDWNIYTEFMTNIALSKDDVEIGSKDIFDQQTTLEIAQYCIHDTLLCRYLFDEYNIQKNIDTFANIYLLSQATSTIFRNSTNNQGPILKSNINKKKILIQSPRLYTDYYSGGKVFDPQENFLIEPVLLLDFESLYPSIMINYNISPDTLILVIDLKCSLEFALAKKNVEYMFNKQDYTIVYNYNPELNKYNILVFTKIDSNNQKRTGILIDMLIELKKKRKYYKQEMKKFENEKNYFQASNCDLIQLAIKVCMNSIYGILGSSFSNISCKFTSQAVTLIGAQAITFLADYISDAELVNNQLIIKNNIDYNPITMKSIIPNQIYPICFDSSEPIKIKIIYGDTDSIMVVPKNINKMKILYQQNRTDYQNYVIIISSYIGKILNDFINRFILEKNLNLEFEAIYLYMILLTKKKYKTFKVEPIENFPTNLTISELNQITNIISYVKDFQLKEENKGISLKRRDNCLFHKQQIVLFYKTLHEKINKNCFNENFKAENLIDANFLKEFITKIKQKLLFEFINNQINYQDFLISCNFTDNYKSEDYYIKNMVSTYNSQTREQILKGDRFYYLFIQKLDRPIKTIIKDLKKSNNKIDAIELFKNIAWTLKDKDINQYKTIYNENYDYKNGDVRISFEIYCHRIVKDIVKIFPILDRFLKIYEQNEKLFVSQLKYNTKDK